MKTIKWDPKENLVPIKLPQEIVSELQKQPQTGKGYQICSLLFKNGVLHSGVPVLLYCEAWIHRNLLKNVVVNIEVDQNNT